MCLLAALVCLASVCSGAEKITVTGSRVNLRAVADPNGEIVGQVAKGDVLSATGVTEGDWIEITPPAAVSVWLYGELVRDGVVAASSVRVRSGPGIGYRPVGSLSKGSSVQVLGTKGDWLQIAPPADCKVWISKGYVSGGSVAPPVAATPTPNVTPPAPGGDSKPPVRVTRKPPPPAVPTPPMPAKRLRKRTPTVRRQPIVPVQPDTDVDIASPGQADPTPPVPAGQALTGTPASIGKLRLVDRAPQGVSVSATGVLRPAGFFPLRRPSPYRLVVSSGTGPAKTACYVLGDGPSIGARLNDRVTLVGKRYWVQGVREAVLVVSEIRD